MIYSLFFTFSSIFSLYFPFFSHCHIFPPSFKWYLINGKYISLCFQGGVSCTLTYTGSTQVALCLQGGVADCSSPPPSCRSAQGSLQAQDGDQTHLESSPEIFKSVFRLFYGWDTIMKHKPISPTNNFFNKLIRSALK